MGITAWIFGFLGGLAMVVGIMTATEVVPILATELTWLFWFILSGLLFLITIALAAGRGGYEE